MFCEEKKTKAYFNTDLLRKYYTQAYFLFELQLVSEKTITNNSRVLLKDLKHQS